MIKHPRQYTFDPSSGFRPTRTHDFQRNPEPVNVFPGDPEEKLQKISRLSTCDRYFQLALNAIRFYFYHDPDEFNPFQQNNGLYRQRYADTKEHAHQIINTAEQFLVTHWEWKIKLETASYHEIYQELICPLKRILEETINKLEE